jgi:5-methylcytosine-specific restriction endonuclease McrA
MQSTELTPRQIASAATRTKAAVRTTFRLLPNIKSTRYRKTSDFYSLVLLMAQFDAHNLVLGDARRNRQARELLTAFSTGVDKLNEQRQRAETVDPDASLYRDYLLTVLQGTDKYPVRLKRQAILRNLLEPIFERKDENRLFSTEQRRILWNSTDLKLCGNSACRRKLGWDDFTADHINPWSKGGRTELENAAIYCRPCNSSKGSRRRSRWRRARRAA